MRNFIALATLLIGLSLISFPSWAADFNKGLIAYNDGDYATALREWTPLAEQGDMFAQVLVGNMYSDGKGVLQDYKTAVKWLTLAAEQGYAHAQLNLGLMYEKGQGVPQDYQTAVNGITLPQSRMNQMLSSI